MSPYYKATHVNGTSFHDSTTRWKVGATVTIPKSKRRKTLCGPGILHVSDAPAETLLGGSWPCRLFLVEPGEIVASNGHKHGTWSVKVVEELPAWQALGPMGEQVAAVIERAERLTATEAKKLSAAARAAAWAAAWDAARDAAGDAARAAAWAAARAAAWAAARAAAGDAAWDAAVAVVTWNLATEDGPYTTSHRDLLIGPWREVVGMPEGLS